MITAKQIEELKGYNINDIFDELIKLSNIHLEYLNYHKLSDEYIVTKNKIQIIEYYFNGFENLIEQRI